ncbi:MAG: exodeoxyribonuclease VII small subunit [Clostridia bacterium]|nr:exodeoxyribonuclease VII small subunit [Clostridia bacterium]
MGFEEKLKRLEEITAALESGSVKLDEAMKLYEEGAALSKELTEILGKAEQKVTFLTSEGGEKDA